MSAIKGEGYGSSHNWIKLSNQNTGHPYRRYSEYKCECGYYFRHYYHIMSDIFEAMKEGDVKEKCINE